MRPIEFPRLYESQYESYVADLPLWLRLVDSHPGPVLELGCGPGRVLVALSKAALEVHGLDHDGVMLSRAREHLAREGARSVSLHQADMGRFRLPQKFSLILAPCNTIATLDERALGGMLHRVRLHLKPGGCFAAEMPNPTESNAPDPHEPLAVFVNRESGNPVQVYASQRMEDSPPRAEVTWSYDELQPDGHVVRLQVETCYHLRHPDGLAAVLRESGFATWQFHGDYDRTPFVPDSPRMIVVAEAPGPVHAQEAQGCT
jgi:trans-aconitate methyltransferase